MRLPVCTHRVERSRKFIPKKVFLLLWSRQHAEGIVGVPMRVPPQKDLESSSGKQAAGSRHSSAPPSTPTIHLCEARRRHPSTERSRKFFSNKVFLLGVAGSTQYRHSYFFLTLSESWHAQVCKRRVPVPLILLL